MELGAAILWTNVMGLLCGIQWIKDCQATSMKLSQFSERPDMLKCSDKIKPVTVCLMLLLLLLLMLLMLMLLLLLLLMLQKLMVLILFY